MELRSLWINHIACRISNCIHSFLWYLITTLDCNFNDGFAMTRLNYHKPLFKVVVMINPCPEFSTGFVCKEVPMYLWCIVKFYQWNPAELTHLIKSYGTHLSNHLFLYYKLIFKKRLWKTLCGYAETFYFILEGKLTNVQGQSMSIKLMQDCAAWDEWKIVCLTAHEGQSTKAKSD